MKILITGASGLLGSKVAEVAVKKGFEVYSCYSTHEVIFGNPLKLNILDFNSVLSTIEQINPNFVVHAAALTDVDLCEKEKNLAFNVNVLGTKNVVEACKRVNAHLVYISTDYVFSGEKGYYREQDETNPLNYYGFTKLEGEKIVKSSGLSYLIARASVIYGSRPAAGKVNFALWAIEKLKKGEVVKAVSDQFVSPTLNTNLAEMLLEAVERNLTGVYHMSGATRVSRFEFVVKLAKIFNLELSLVKAVSMKDLKWVAKRPRDSSLNVDKAKSLLKNKPLEVDEAIKRLKLEVEENA
ncbi:MAG: dTDP-4-dehydrorhamnose reductase [Candidatus Bathyarchaeales archaeon]